MNIPTNAGENAIREYLENWLIKNKPSEDEDYLGKSIYELVKAATENSQYTFSTEFTPVKRVIKFRIGMPVSAMKKSLGITPISVYGCGVFTVVDGVFMSSASREKSGYDGRGRWRKFDLSFVPDDILSEYDFSLATPAFNGLFIPKKSPLTSWMSSVNQIQYFDLSDC